ncbi:DNA (cytosine-5-)-methyltransferase [Leminorella grimontii]|uniref:DNA cytosine methyltransferase n=1 Tax=Leminorella grimontii TaxID=82981 RepID=UPI0032204F85
MGSRRLKAISLYTGVGGLDFGFEAADFDTVVAVELDTAACSTIRLNRPNWNLIEGDIHNISSDEIINKSGSNVGEIDILIGGPPCQPFSKSSYWVNGDTLRLDDPRADTLTAYLRVLRDTQPKSFLIENVAGLVYKGKDEGLQHLLSGIKNINNEVGTNYKVSWKALNAANFGVPQNRERVFLIGSRDGKDFVFPESTHEDEKKAYLFGKECYRTAWDAIGDLDNQEQDYSAYKVGGKWGDLLSTIPEGQNYLWHTSRGGGESLFGWRTRYWSFLLKLAKNQPSWTIQAQPGSSIGPFHWKNRKLTPYEMCRLQTFPDGLIFKCAKSDIQKMIGNAVPSLLSEVLAREIRHQFFDEKKRNDILKLLPPTRYPIPEPEALTPLPQKYRLLIGEYPDHPGKKRA